ncbi:MAG: hypothetical protein HY200_10490 [Nitrospirae bacterium]|nr:hypothetical protein [Nitrospirota bacterium]MBI3595372.1 hypothetical protein [Nitrospirota bacterium]
MLLHASSLQSKTFQIREEPPSPYECGYQDGPARQAKFCNPFDIVSDGKALYVTDAFNHVIRKIVISSGVVSTLVGSGGSFGSIDETGQDARFRAPHGLTIDHQGTTLYLCDSGNHTIRKIDLANRRVSTLAGKPGYFGLENGAGHSARFNEPSGITIDPTDVWLYIADTANHMIRKIEISTGSVTTIAGRPGYLGFQNGIGEKARFDHPAGITIDPSGRSLYVTDSSNQAIRKVIVETAEVTTITFPSGQSLFFPLGITVNQINTLLFIADTANHVLNQFGLSTGELRVYPLTSAGSLLSPIPQGVTFDPSGKDIYFTDKKTNTINKLNLFSKVISTFAGPPFSFPSLP